MTGILDWGLGLVREVQTIANPALTSAIKVLTLLGNEYFFLAALPLIYWCVDRRRGVRLSIIVLFSSFLNLWIKGVFAQPRPFQLDPKVGMAYEPTYGFPSAHAQVTVVFWGAAARLLMKPWGLVLALALPLLVGFTRVYLGVHFPTDIFGGWIFGAVILAIDYGFGDRIERLLAGLQPRILLMIAAVLALGMNAINMADTSLSGVFFGAAAGFIYVPKVVPFKTAGGLGQKGLRLLVGLAGAAVLYLGLKAVFPGQGSEQYALFRFLRYGLVGAWVAIGAPWVFARLKLVELEA